MGSPDRGDGRRTNVRKEETAHMGKSVIGQLFN